MRNSFWRGRAWLWIGAGLIIALAVGLLVGGSQIFSILSLRISGGDVAPQVNAYAPDFELISLSGSSLSLSSLRGKPVVVNFWATWCAPCVEEMPAIQKYYEKYPGEFEVVAVNADEPEIDVRQFVSDMGLTFNVVLDPGGKIQGVYQLRGYPTTFFVDAAGIIRVEHIGQLHGDQLAAYLNDLGIGE